MITLSRLQQIAACPGSAALPRPRRVSLPALLGTAIHELCETQIRCIDETPETGAMLADNIARAHNLSADDAGRLAFLASHLRLPIPAGALAEVPLGWWPDGSVRRVEGGAGEYRDDGQWLSGTIDVMWSEPEPLMVCRDLGPHFECGVWGKSGMCPDHMPTTPRGSTLWVVDTKTGDDEYVTPIDRNWQLRAGAVLAARWTGAQRVIPALCYINAAECAEAVRAGRPYEGRWEVGATLDAAALDKIEVEMRAVLVRARGEEYGRARLGQRAQVQAVRDDAGPGGEVAREACVLVQDEPGPRLDAEAPTVRAHLILGPHCEHCGSRASCPELAREALTLARADGSEEGAREGLALTPESAARLASLIPAIRRACDAAEQAVQAHVRATGPLTLPNGQEYGPAIETTERFITRPTYEALAEIVGDAAADAAFLATEDRIKAALRGDAKRLPRGAWAAFVERVRERGGVIAGAREVWRKRWPAKPTESDP